MTAAAVMAALWPRYGTGRRFLRRWHVAEPDDEQIAVAVRYLRNRRLPIVPIMVLFLLAQDTVGVRPGSDDLLNLFTLLGSLLVALLIAELLAGLQRPQGVARTASLVRRRAHDLVPGYAVWLHAALTVVTVSVALIGLAAQPAVARALERLPPNEGSELVLADEYRADLAHPIGWPIVLGTVLVALVVLAVVWRTTMRPADRDERIDLVLRVRSVRVAVGTGIALTGALSVAAAERVSRMGSFLHGRPTVGDPIGRYSTAGPAFPADTGVALPGWLEVPFGITGALGLILLLTGLLGWVWVVNPPSRLSALSGI
jgi:hypothetical protein